MDTKLTIKGKPWEKLKKFDQGILTGQVVKEAGVIAVNFSKDTFRTKSWHDRTREKWKPRKRKDRGSLMARTGRLKRSIRRLSYGTAYVLIGTDVPYAKAHNEGEHIKGTIEVRSHSRKLPTSKRIRQQSDERQRETTRVRSHKRKMNTKLPQRKFIGASHTLSKMIEYYMKKQAERMLK